MALTLAIAGSVPRIQWLISPHRWLYPFAIFKQMLTHLHATGLEAVSLSVSRSNPARKLYERHGFSLVKNQKNSCTMLIELT